MAQLTIIGNVTRDPELRYTQSGTAVASFSVAENRKVNEEERVSFYDVTAWKEMAENVAESITKGQRVIVHGQIEQDTYEDKEGNKKSKFKVTAWEVGPSIRWATAAVTKNARNDG